MRYKINMAFAAIFSVAAPQAWASNLVTNGGFEAGFTTPPYYRYLSNGDNTTIPGWTASDDGIGERSYIMSRVGYPGGVVDGDYSIFMNQGTALSTSVALAAGQSYQLTFFARQGANKLADPLQVTIGGYTTTLSPNGYANISFLSNINSPNAILKFYNPSPVGDFRAYVLDSVSLTTVPIPGAAWLFGSAIVAFGFGKKQRMLKPTR